MIGRFRWPGVPSASASPPIAMPPLSEHQSRAFVAGLLAESFAETNHPGQACTPDDVCWRAAARLFFGKWLIETHRLTDGEVCHAR